MNVKAIFAALCQRQFGEELALLGAEPAAGPLDRGLGYRIHGFRRGADRVVMIAAHRHRAVIAEPHHMVNSPRRLGAAADELAKSDHALAALPTGGFGA